MSLVLPRAAVRQPLAALLPSSVLPRRRVLFWGLVWALGLLLLCVAGLNLAPLLDVDEGAFSEATRELLASGDWGFTTLYGAPRFDKPILIYWLQAASVQLFGLNEWALRLPSALCTWGWALALALFAAPRWGLTAALVAGTLVPTSLGVVLIGRAATADALLNLLITLAALDLWRHLEQGASPTGRAPLRRAALWIGLGLLAKGPVALLVPGMALLLWCVSGREWSRLRAALTDAPAWGLMLLVAAPWYAYALHRHGWAFIDGFLIRHNLARYGGTLEGHAGGPLYYLAVLPLLLMPWSALLWTLLRQVRALWAEPLARYLLGWAGFVLVFFSLSGTKLPHYLLYGCTPLWLLMARIWVGAPQQGSAEVDERPSRPVLALVLLPGLMLLTAAALAGALLPQMAAGVADPLYRALLQAPADATPLQLAALASGLLTGLAALWWWHDQRQPAALLIGPGWRRPLPLLAAAVLTTLLQALVVLPWWADRLQQPVRDLALAARAEPGTVVQWRLHQPSFALYLGQPTPQRPPQPGERALLRQDDLPRLPPPGPSTWTPLAERPGYLLLRWLGPAEAVMAPESGR